MANNCWMENPYKLKIVTVRCRLVAISVYQWFFSKIHHILNQTDQYESELQLILRILLIEWNEKLSLYWRLGSVLDVSLLCAWLLHSEKIKIS